MSQGLKIAFAAGDVGGARAILPVARLAKTRGYHVIAMKHGPFHAEGETDWDWRDVSDFHQAEFWQSKQAVLIYATSVKDHAAIDSAIVAKKLGVPVVHVLDNWSSYGERLSGSHGIPCIPDCYAVMDELALRDAAAHGVPEKILRVTGQPSLARMFDETLQVPASPNEVNLRLLFVSEPAKQDSGGRTGANWRGYDEDEVSTLLIASLVRGLSAIPLSEKTLELQIAPHPREDDDVVQRRWHGLCAYQPITLKILDRSETRSALHAAHAVSGMTSILLYESWLLGKPTLSLQPGLRLPSLRALGKREGLIFCDVESDADACVSRLLRMASSTSAVVRQELTLHRNAAASVLSLALDFGLQPSKPPDEMKENTA